MRLTIAYCKIKKRNLVLINNDTYQRETLSERPIRQPLRLLLFICASLCIIKYHQAYTFVTTKPMEVNLLKKYILG